MSPHGEDATTNVGDAQAKCKSAKDNSTPGLPDARNMFQSQQTKITFTFAFKPKSIPPFANSMACNEGGNFAVGLNLSEPSLAQILESQIRKSVEGIEFESFHGEIQFFEPKPKNLLELNEMGKPIAVKENKLLPHSSSDYVTENHDLGTPNAPEIPPLQSCGSGFQKKGASVSSCKCNNVQEMKTENVAVASFNEVNNNQFTIRTSAKEMCGFDHDQKALNEMENCSDTTCKRKKRGEGNMKRSKRSDHGIQKRLRLKESSKDKAVQILEDET